MSTEHETHVTTTTAHRGAKTVRLELALLSTALPLGTGSPGMN